MSGGSNWGLYQWIRYAIFAYKNVVVANILVVLHFIFYIAVEKGLVFESISHIVAVLE